MASKSSSEPLTFSFTTEQLQALAKAITSAQSLPHPIAATSTVPAPPPFTSIAEPVTPNKSLFALFPNIEGRHVLDITRHEFRPCSLHQLEHRNRSRASDTINFGGQVDTRAQRGGSVRDKYPTLDSVIVPLLTYFNILIAYTRLGGNPDAGCRYQWAAVFDYHVEYMNLRRYEMKEGNYLGWGSVEGPLYALVIANPRHKPSNPTRRSNYKPKPPRNQGEYPDSYDGAGQTNTLPQCLDGHQHICYNCGSSMDHKLCDARGPGQPDMSLCAPEDQQIPRFSLLTLNIEFLTHE
ncbi:hypothetical protein EV361DRAFT_835613 [Lentinula raphanica]|nr:hypothetical protein EV361DRAFT_835613 [Lentinula raphanica]